MLETGAHRDQKAVRAMVAAAPVAQLAAYTPDQMRINLRGRFDRSPRHDRVGQ
jgi:hypothetical protein